MLTWPTMTSRCSIQDSMITGSKIKLRNRKLADARDEYIWRTDPELARLDATSLLTTSFPQYQSAYAGELCYPTSTKREFAIETLDGKHIGNCIYYDINESKGEAELGIIIGNRNYRDKGYGTDAVTTLVNHIFRQTNLKRIYLKTLDWNTRAQKCFKKCGFTEYGHLARDGFSFLLMEIYHKQWQERQIETQ